jgi:hypothetical protein
MTSDNINRLASHHIVTHVAFSVRIQVHVTRERVLWYFDVLKFLVVMLHFFSLHSRRPHLGQSKLNINETTCTAIVTTEFIDVDNKKWFTKQAFIINPWKSMIMIHFFHSQYFIFSPIQKSNLLYCDAASINLKAHGKETWVGEFQLLSS